MMQCSARTELERLFQTLSSDEISFESITTSAFTQARAKFSEQAFVELNQDCILAPFYSHSDYKKWNGFRLLSVDGSLLELPPESALYKAYGKLNPQARLPGARLSQLYDPLNQLTLEKLRGQVFHLDLIQNQSLTAQFTLLSGLFI
ncbi:hypothetical protein C2869_07070 [Saccharobesus litoralis]|uniref:Uncharacterized protein n=2 Tax=Saccharobesus litoralis TaxID=2172099 RepID=A0A2S0VQ48_9ALTE|nr:hypothetical protein C2869_07070 [Saccharobesus litoralis]